MGKALVIQGGNFGPNAIYSGGRYTYVNNNFTWGKGGINTPGTSSGSTNAAMSMVGLPLEHAEEELYFVGANGYKIQSLLTSDLPSPSSVPSAHEYTYAAFSPYLDGVTIPSGKYFQINIARADGENADVSAGSTSLLLRQEV